MMHILFFFFSSRRRHTRWPRDWSSDVCSSDLHEMLGKVAFDRLDHGTAFGHFLQMQQLGEALDDADILELAAVHQGDVLRRRGEYELAVQRLQSAASHSPQASRAVEGLRQQTLARAHAEH